METLHIYEYATGGVTKIRLFEYKLILKDDNLILEIDYDNSGNCVAVSDLDEDSSYLLMQLSSLFFNDRKNIEINSYTSGHLIYFYQLITSLSDTTLTKLYKACKTNYSKLLCANITKFIIFYVENKKPKLAKRANLEMKLEK